MRAWFDAFGILRLFLLTCLLPASAFADLSFVQIVQGQTSRGQDGIFGKTWVEVQEGKMRLVSGYARKLRDGREEKDPQRLIQIIDLHAGRRVVVNPEKKTFSRAPLDDVDYGHGLRGELRRGRSQWSIVAREITLTKKQHTRQLLGMECGHYHLHMRMTLEGPDGRTEQARMDQHVWVAPVTGKLSKNILDLIAFENAYRKKTGGALSPLDHERYQLREAAAYLRVSEGDLLPIIETVRERLRGLPSYPVASSVSWWRDTKKPEPDKKKEVALGDISPERFGGEVQSGRRRSSPPPVKPKQFHTVDWRRSEQRINRMYSRTRRQVGGAAFGPLQPRSRMVQVQKRTAWPQEPVVYSKFEKELQSVLRLLIKEQEEGFEEVRQAEPPSSDRSPGTVLATVPFYEIYTEIYGLETRPKLDRQDFALPKGYKDVSR
ncbi:MAG: hypothetical protein ABIJ96_01510 [Elusimicrobiota bacterium]